MEWAVREFDPAAEPATWEAVVRLRVSGWAALVPFPVASADALDSHDATARHWVAVADGRPVGAARLTVHDTLTDVPEAGCLGDLFSTPPPVPIGFLSRLVVAPEYRRLGIGRKLDELRIRAADEAGCRTLLAMVFEPSGQARVEQLVGHGFTIRGVGRKDPHPTWSVLPPPLILERQIGG